MYDVQVIMREVYLPPQMSVYSPAHDLGYDFSVMKNKTQPAYSVCV